MTKIEDRKKALLALRILQNNERQSVALSVFHDEICDYDEEISEYRKLCVKALEAGGCPIESMPKFSDWFQTMDDEAKEVFRYDLEVFMRKSLAALERYRAEAIEFLKRKLNPNNSFHFDF